MMPRLPPELWQQIFSYLDLRSLCTARAVCKSWWEHINHDYLWRPLVEQRGIPRRVLPVTNDDSDTDLKNCKWAGMCFGYYQKVLTNWAEKRCKITEAPRSTDTTEIQLPYMVRVFDGDQYVEILELREGEFVQIDKIQLPGDQSDGPPIYDLTMNTNSVFVVNEWNRSIIFKLYKGSFRFEKALFFLGDGQFMSCSDESKLSSYITLYSSTLQVFAVAVSEETIWMYWLYPPHVVKAIYAWNYCTSEVVLTLRPTLSSPFPILGTSDQYICWFFDHQFSVYSLDSTPLFCQKVEDVIRVVWNDIGCALITLKGGKRKASFVDLYTPEAIHLDVENPLAIAMHGIDKLAYCLCMRDKDITIACVSTLTGRLSWQTNIASQVNRCPPITYTTALEMRVIHGKYIVLHEVNGEFEDIFSKNSMSLYSTTDGRFIWSHRFASDTAHVMVSHLSDHFLMTSIEEGVIIVNAGDEARGFYEQTFDFDEFHNIGGVLSRGVPRLRSGEYVIDIPPFSASCLANPHNLERVTLQRVGTNRRPELGAPDGSDDEINGGAVGGAVGGAANVADDESVEDGCDRVSSEDILQAIRRFMSAHGFPGEAGRHAFLREHGRPQCWVLNGLDADDESVEPEPSSLLFDDDSQQNPDELHDRVIPSRREEIDDEAGSINEGNAQQNPRALLQDGDPDLPQEEAPYNGLMLLPHEDNARFEVALERRRRKVRIYNFLLNDHHL